MDIKSIIYLTSSTKKMYDFSGIKLLNSFLKHQKESKLVYLTENFNLNMTNDNIIEYDIANYDFLKNWLEKNKDVIPVALGGLLEIDKNICTSSGPKTPLLWNYKASLWFRKVAALHYVYTNFKEYQYIIWIDNDCEIMKPFDKKFLNSLFNKTDMFYFLGSKRKIMDTGVESGFIGWKKNNNNFPFLVKLFETFKSGDFKKIKRWDDGYVIKYLLLNYFQNYGNDLGKMSNTCNPMAFDYFKKYIIHKKGTHWRNNIDNLSKKEKPNDKMILSKNVKKIKNNSVILVYLKYNIKDKKSVNKFKICKKSLFNYNKNIKIIELEENTINTKYNLKNVEIYKFLIPLLNNYKDWVLYCDCSVEFLCDINNIFKNFCNDNLAIVNKDKLTNILLINCSHKNNQKLTLDLLKKNSLEWFNNFHWLFSNQIRTIDNSINYFKNIINE